MQNGKSLGEALKAADRDEDGSFTRALNAGTKFGDKHAHTINHVAGHVAKELVKKKFGG